MILQLHAELYVI